MVDRDDDLKIGIKTSAITFGRWDVRAIMSSYAITLALILWSGWELGLRWPFVGGILLAGGIAIYHYQLIKNRDRDLCFAAFRHNNWLGAAIFTGVVFNYALR
jgi:4-hydroxybenzoate polyprenyltransferase